MQHVTDYPLTGTVIGTCQCPSHSSRNPTHLSALLCLGYACWVLIVDVRALSVCFCSMVLAIAVVHARGHCHLHRSCLYRLAGRIPSTQAGEGAWQCRE